MRRMGVMAVALAAVMAVGCNRSDSRAASGSAVGTAGRSDSGVSARDRDFVRDVAVMNMAEIELSRVALEKSAAPDVKKFAQLMVDDHTAAGDKLKAVATQYQIEVPAQLDDKHRELRDKLAARQGLDVDKEYADAMVAGHDDFVETLESRVDKETLSKWKTDYTGVEGKATVKGETQAVIPEKSDNPATMAINQWAADTYPVAYGHREAAKVLRDAVKKRSTN